MALGMAIERDNEPLVKIKVIGVGGGGGNAVNHMVDSGVSGVEFVSINTDAIALNSSRADYKVTIGAKLTSGRGAGGDPDVGRKAAEESREQVSDILKDAQIVFVTAGMGGGTGTGAAPIVASIAKEMGILTVGIVTKPFLFERERRMKQAELGITELRQNVDALVVIPNERLKLLTKQKLSMKAAFAASNDVLRQGVQSICDLINIEGYINLDFADITSVMEDAGYAHMGIGYGQGENKVEDAVKMAVSSPLLETSIKGANGVIMNITANSETDLDEIEQASSTISQYAGEGANIIWGVAFDDDMDKDMIKLTVIATGFEELAPFMDEPIAVKADAKKDAEKTATATTENKPASSQSPAIDDAMADIFAIFNKNKI